MLNSFTTERQAAGPGRVWLLGGGGGGQKGVLDPTLACLSVSLPRAPLHPASVLSGFECVFCNFVCKTKNMFERHLQIHLITRMFECDVCHKFMKTPEQLLEHKKCHTVPTGGLK